MVFCHATRDITRQQDPSDPVVQVKLSILTSGVPSLVVLYIAELLGSSKTRKVSIPSDDMNSSAASVNDEDLDIDTVQQ